MYIVQILVIKTGALGDVLRTTCVLPGLKQRFPISHITWLTAPNAVDLITHHPHIDSVIIVDTNNPNSVKKAGVCLAETCWDRVLSFEEDKVLCSMVGMLVQLSKFSTILCGAYCDYTGKLRYTPDSSKWFDMSLISIYSKMKADQLKKKNTESHSEIFAHMVGIPKGKPALFLPNTEIQIAQDFYHCTNLNACRPVIGLNTGASNRWKSKRLPEECTAALACELQKHIKGVSFILLGGPLEQEYNNRIRVLLENKVHFVDSGTYRSLLEFAAIISFLDLLLSSDTLALHIAIARNVPVVCFFSPTSATEIELYGHGEKVISLSNDYCSYKCNTDNSSITTERLAEACYRVLRSLPEDYIKDFS